MGSPTILRGAVALTIALAFGPQPVAAREDAPSGRPEGPPKGVSLTGYWTLDRDRSDDPRQKVREAMEGMRPGDSIPGGEMPAGPGVDVMTPGDPRVHDPFGAPRGRRPGTIGPDPRSAVFAEIEQPKELTIAQRSALVLIQEGDDEDDVRGIHTDGQPRPIPGGGGTMSGAWEDGHLVVETRRDDGLRRTETFELSADGRELTVTVHLAAPHMRSLTVTSVYERAEVPDRRSP
jgi:hypothetical protein